MNTLWKVKKTMNFRCKQTGVAILRLTGVQEDILGVVEDIFNSLNIPHIMGEVNIF